MPLDWGFSESIYLEESDIVSYSPTEAPFCNICRYQTLTSRHLLTTSINKIENLLGPLKMCHCDVVLNCYSIAEL